MTSRRETPWKPCTHDDSSWCTEDCLPPEKRGKGLLDRRETPRDPDLIEGDPKEFWDRALAELRLLPHGLEMEKRIRQLERALASAREEIGRLQQRFRELGELYQAATGRKVPINAALSTAQQPPSQTQEKQT